MPIEFATMAFATPGTAVPAAVAAERAGFDIVHVTDSQCLRGDVYTQLMLCGQATSRIKLATGVTNPLTRHPSVTAASIVSIQAECGNRAILGIGRGDSAVLHIGRTPARMREYGEYVRRLQAYLRGETVDQAGFPSRLRWLDRIDAEKVPVDMVGSGPKSLALAAELADRVTMAVGVDPGRIEWGLEQVRAAARAAGRDPGAIPVGAYVNVSVDDDEAAAVRTARGFTATFAHFSASVGADFDNQPEILRNVTEKLVTDYDTNHHSQADAPHTELLDAEFIDWFGAVGSTAKVIRRLAPLVELGLDHLYFVGPRTGLAEEVMPALRGMRS
ncbi:MAG: LLM class flavin-dependent oxidoreductase [Gammaproteobacteria bacterium]|nr:LLM class flavin-dependent oxidoreductase [Gammaproteobacteria bacterium]